MKATDDVKDDDDVGKVLAWLASSSPAAATAVGHQDLRAGRCFRA